MMFAWNVFLAITLTILVLSAFIGCCVGWFRIDELSWVKAFREGFWFAVRILGGFGLTCWAIFAINAWLTPVVTR
jgi:hypothetical protein